MPETIELIILRFKTIVADEMKCTPEEINEDETFHELGLDSINSVFMMEEVEKEYNVTLSSLSFWDYPTIRLFAAHVQSLL
jgi:acyl carrier protein